MIVVLIDDFCQHIFGVGFTGSYLLASRLTKSQIVEDAQALGMKTSADAEKFYVKTDRISAFGLRPDLNYGYSLSPKIEIGAKLGVQAIQQVKQNVFDGESRILPIESEVYFRWKINK